MFKAFLETISWRRTFIRLKLHLLAKLINLNRFLDCNGRLAATQESHICPILFVLIFSFCHYIFYIDFSHLPIILILIREDYCPISVVCSSEEWQRVSKSERERIGVTVQDDGEFW